MRECNLSMSKPSSYSDDNDSRDYFRVTSEIKIRYSLCSLQQIKDDYWPSSLHKSESQQLMEALRSIEHDYTPTLRAISEQNRQLEHYLRSINKRIDLIARYLHASSDTHEDSESQEVLISEGGLEFSAPAGTLLQIDEHAAFEIILLPTHTSLAVYGRIINCHKEGDEQKVGIEFVALKEIERQQLAKHVIQQQLQDKRDTLKEKS